MEAARIAKHTPGTTVAITASYPQEFIDGFNAIRPGSVFVSVPGIPYGKPDYSWEHTEEMPTMVYVVP
jgi:hypothetical protein